MSPDPAALTTGPEQVTDHGGDGYGTRVESGGFLVHLRKDGKEFVGTQAQTGFQDHVEYLAIMLGKIGQCTE